MDSLQYLFQKAHMPASQIIKMNSIQKLCDKLFGLFAFGAAACAIVATYQSYHLVAWPEVQANIQSTDYSCLAMKREWWQKFGTSASYVCGDVARSKELTGMGFTTRGARTLYIAVEFQTLDGKQVSAIIDNYEQDIPDTDKFGTPSIRYLSFQPESAQFADIIFNGA